MVMKAPSAYRLPTGELVFSNTATFSLADFGQLPWRFFSSELFGFLTAFVVSLSALCLAGG